MRRLARWAGALLAGWDWPEEQALQLGHALPHFDIEQRTLLDLANAAVVARSGGIDMSVDAFVEDLVATFVSVYAFAAPIGATLTLHLLLERTDRVPWALSALSLVAIGTGLLAGL